MTSTINVLLAGVGGQGTLVAGKLLGQVALTLGLDARISEVHGMAQRGGSVTTAVKLGPTVFSPVIEAGTLQYLLAFEELEALRWAPLLAPAGIVLINREQLLPVTVQLKQAVYPADGAEALRRRLGPDRVHLIEASRLAQEAGSVKATNVVMLGALSRFMDLPQAHFLSALEVVLPPHVRQINQRAFELGSAIIDTAATT